MMRPTQSTSINREHEEIDLLLPWYVNGTLQKRQVRQVERHLAVCSRCQRELETLRSLRSAVILSNEELPSPSTHGLEQVLATIEAEERLKRVERALWWQALWNRLRALVLPPPLPAFRLVPVLAVVIIVVQLAAIVGLVGREYFWPGSYRALSGPSEGMVSEHPRIVIIFQEGVSERALRGILLPFEGNIVKGPTSEGAYVVEVKRPLQAPQELDRILDELRAKTRLVKVAEKAG